MAITHIYHLFFKFGCIKKQTDKSSIYNLKPSWLYSTIKIVFIYYHIIFWGYIITCAPYTIELLYAVHAVNLIIHDNSSTHYYTTQYELNSKFYYFLIHIWILTFSYQ